MLQSCSLGLHLLFFMFLICFIDDVIDEGAIEGANEGANECILDDVWKT